MTVDPAIFEKASQQARQAADAARLLFESAAAKGDTPDQRELRRQAARQFIQMHCPDWKPDQVAAYLAGIDFGQPVQVVNMAGKTEADMAPKARFISFSSGRTQYLRGERFKPAKPEDPVYALKSEALK